MAKRLSRREFIQGGVIAGVAAGCPGVVFLAEGASAARPFEMSLKAHMIWSAESAPVPLILAGRAAGIASSADGKLPDVVPDLHSVFVREIQLSEIPVSAVMHIFAYTRYRLYINGHYIGRGPCRYQNQRPEYDTRAIRGALRVGSNRIAVLVHRDAPTGRIMRHAPGFAAVILMTAGDKTEAIVTDTAWHARPDHSFGQRDAAWASIEEHVDARKGIDLWALTAPGDATEWKAGEWKGAVPVGGASYFPVWPRTSPMQMEKRVPCSPAPAYGSTTQMLRVSEIVQGYHVLTLECEAGSEVEVRYLLPQGQSSGASTYVARGGVQVWMGRDTFCFRELALRIKSGRVKLLKAEVYEVRYPFARAASFESSDAMLNQLWTICARSLELLSEDSYVDCADRERVEWTDDSPPAFDLTRVAMRGPDGGGATYWGDNRLLKGLLRRIGLTQQPDGQLKAHSCSERFDIHAIMEDRSCDWVVLLREYYESSGDKALVEELWATLMRLLGWFDARLTGRGLVLAREWEVWDNPLRYQVCEGAGLNAMYYRALVDAAYLAAEVGKTNDAGGLSARAERLKAAFNSLLWNGAEGTYDGALFGPGSKLAEQLNGKVFAGPFVDGPDGRRYGPTAQAVLFALYAGVVPEERLKAARTWMLAHLDEVTGPMSHYYLFRALYAMENAAQDRLVLERMRAGWKLQVESPWQTTWEDLVDEGGSKVHMYGVVPGSFLTTHVLGVRREGHVRERRILIEPRMADLTSAGGIAVTEFGPVRMKWTKMASGTVTIEVVTPEKTEAALRLYSSGESRMFLVDGARREGSWNGGFAEVLFTAGTHQIQYPV